MGLTFCFLSCLLIGFSKAAPNVFDGYVKCADGSRPQKDDSGRILACDGGQQTYGSCQTSYQCTTPLAGRPGICCKMGYVAPTPGPQTDAPPPQTAPPPPPPETVAPPPASSETIAPPPPDTEPPQTPPPPVTEEASTTTMAATAGGGGGEMTPPPPAPFTSLPPADTTTGSGAMNTDTPTGGAGGMETSYPTVPPEILETTTNINSVDVVTDSSGGAMVSPNAIAENRRHGTGNRTGAQDVNRARQVARHRATSPRPSVHASRATKIIRSFNGATIILKASHGGSPKPSTAAPRAPSTASSEPTSSYPMRNRRPLAAAPRV